MAHVLHKQEQKVARVCGVYPLVAYRLCLNAADWG